MKLSGKIKGILTDSVWSIAGIVLMNAVAQFVVYPIWNRELGAEQYGNILSLISVLNIFAISLGSGANYSRMVLQMKKQAAEPEYIMILLIGSILAIPYSIAAACLYHETAGGVGIVLVTLTAIFIIWRYYADVEYRINTNYRKYFLYYAGISAGYLIGIGLFLLTGRWELALIPGEIVGPLLVIYRNMRSKKNGDRTRADREALKIAGGSVMTLLAANVISNLIFNGDRILLRVLLDGTSVTIYYLASLLGKTMSLLTTPFNSVIIGYLAKYSGKLSVKMMNLTAGLAAIMAVAGTVGCMVGSFILIPILYPDQYREVIPYLILANGAQVLYFIGNTITVILLRFSAQKYQMYVNIVYAIAFFAFCPILTVHFGISGFCIGMFLTSLVRMIICFFYGYRDAFALTRNNE